MKHSGGKLKLVEEHMSRGAGEGLLVLEKLCDLPQHRSLLCAGAKLL